MRRDGDDVDDYIVPMPTQLIAHIAELLQETGGYEFAFPGRNDPSIMMSENTLNTAIKRIGLGWQADWPWRAWDDFYSAV